MQELRQAVEPVGRRVKQLTEAQFERRFKFALMGIFIGFVITCGVAWLAQPAAYTTLQARWWHNWQTNNFTQAQADKLNKLLAEFEQENATREIQAGAASK